MVDLKFGRRLRLRRESGIGAMEVAISSFLAIALSAFAADTTIVLYAFFVNDMCARDAARAAGAVATNSNQTQSTASSLAQYAATNQLTVHGTDGFFIAGTSGEHHPTLLTTTPDWQYAPDGWPPTQTLPNNYSPFSPSGTITAPRVTATTVVNVQLPLNPSFFGVNLFGSTAGGLGKIQFKRAYTFPIVNTALTN